MLVLAQFIPLCIIRVSIKSTCQSTDHRETHRWFESDVGYMIAQQLQLLVTLVVLFSQVLVLLFEFPQLVSDPFLYPRCLRLYLPGVLQP